jgi:hypothetical protein
LDVMILVLVEAVKSLKTVMAGIYNATAKNPLF